MRPVYRRPPGYSLSATRCSLLLLRRQINVVLALIHRAEAAPLVLGEMAVVDVDDAGELPAEEAGDYAKGWGEGVREGVAAVAEEADDGEAFGLEGRAGGVRGEGDDAGIGEPVGVLAEELVQIVGRREDFEG